MRSFRHLVICLAALALLSVVAICAVGSCEGQRATLTLMVYMCGSDLESRAGAATEDLEEMMAAMPADGSVEIVALAGGSTDWKSDIDPEAANIYRLTPQGIELAEAGAPACMGDGATRERLLGYGHDYCPAERYALLLWDHGAGPMMGVCFDEHYTEGQGMDGLTLIELRDALADSPFADEKLAWIGFDACLMASAETACVVAPYAEYMIASQETEPAEGWCYGFLADAARDASGAETGRRAVDAYAGYYEGSLSDITLSCVDLSKMGAVAAEMSALYEGFTVEPANYAHFARGRNEARSIGSGVAYAYDLVDLADLMEVYEAENIAECGALRTALAEAVVCNYANVPFHNGLSLYYPFDNKSRYMSPWASVANEIDFAEGYRAFIQRSSAIWLGEALADWREPNHISSDGAERNVLTLELSDGQLAQYAGSRLLVLEEAEPGMFRPVYNTEDVALRGNLLTASYSGEALFIMDEAGLPRSGAVYYREKDGDLHVLATVYLPDETSTLGRRAEVVWLRYRPSGAGGYAFVDASVIGEDGLAGKSTLRLEDCAEFEFATIPCVPVRDDAGKLLPYSQWDFSTYRVGDWINDILPDTVTFLPLYDEEPRWAMFEITDLQGEVYASELYALPNDNRVSLQLPRQTLLDSEVCAVTLEAAEASVGAYPSLDLTCTLENRTDQRIRVFFRNLWFDATQVADTPVDGLAYLDGGEKQTRRLRITASTLRDARVRRLDILRFDIEVERRDDGAWPVTENQRVGLPLRLDAGMLISDAAYSSPLDSATWGDVDVELLDVDQSSESYAKALIRFANRGAEAIRIGWDRKRFRLNDVPRDGYFLMDSLELPPGGDACLWATFLNEDGRTLRERVERLEFAVYAYDDDRFDAAQRRDEAVVRLEAGNDGG